MEQPFEPGLLRRLPEPPRKVVVLRASRLGDLICATPALRALRAALPGAEIALITLPILAELAARLPSVDRTIPFPGFPGLAEQFFDARQALRFFGEMQAEQFDLAVQMQGSGVYANPFVLLLGARRSAGLVRDRSWAGRLDAALPLSRRGREVRRLLALTTFLGAPPQGEHTEFPLWPADREAAAELLAGVAAPLIGLHPGAREPARQWPPARLAAAGAALRQRLGGTVLVLGGPEDQAAAQAVAETAGPPCLNLAGRTGLAGLGAVIERLAVLVANDSGPAHVAYALRTPAAIVFGSASPARYGPPRGTPARLVRTPPAGRRPPVESGALRDLDAIEVEQVVRAAHDLVRELRT